MVACIAGEPGLYGRDSEQIELICIELCTDLFVQALAHDSFSGNRRSQPSKVINRVNAPVESTVDQRWIFLRQAELSSSE